MKKIGGNITAILQKKVTEKNEIGEDVTSFVDYKTLKGFLDFMTGQVELGTYNANIQESTHVFICDVFAGVPDDENAYRMVINGKIYEIKLIDNPMKLNKHIEFYLSYVGR